jgi:hypothetical protein
MIKLAGAFMLVIVLLLSMQIHKGRAGQQYQTIPTMPPTTAIIPTTLPDDTPTNPPQLSATYHQPTDIAPSQTAGMMASATLVAATPSSSSVPSATGQPGGETMPILTSTLTPTNVTDVFPTSSPVPTKTPGSSGVLCGLIGGGIVLLVAIGVWWLKSRKK